jgi:hypothetical protein
VSKKSGNKPWLAKNADARLTANKKKIPHLVSAAGGALSELEAGDGRRDKEFAFERDAGDYDAGGSREGRRRPGTEHTRSKSEDCGLTTRDWISAGPANLHAAANGISRNVLV